ncbi:MAG: FAD-dependent monooxygenase [Thalassovita sp.]
MSLLGVRVTVVGGGIGGLAAARALALRGAQVTLLEQAEAISEVGAGLQVTPNGFAVLQALGLGQGVAARAMQAQAVSLRDYRRGEVTRLDLTQLKDQNYYLVHRADLIDVLAAGARDAGVQIRLLQQVDRIEPGPQPKIHLANGAQLTTDLVIGADGLHSKLRPALNGADAPFFTGQVAWRAIVPNVDHRPAEAWLHMAPGRHLVSYPLRDGQHLNVVAVQERQAWVNEGWTHRDSPQALQKVFADFDDEARAILDQVKEVYLWGLFRHPVAETWQGGHCALLGDAAHPTLPFLAQGASMALEDAWALAEELAASDSLPAGLSAYQNRRRARARQVIDAATGNARKYHLKFPPLRFAAHTGLRTIGRVAPKFLLTQMEWLYGHDETALRGNQSS